MMNDFSSFHAQKLGREERETYEALKRGLLARRDVIRCPYSFYFRDAVSAVNYDCPSLFYVNWVESYQCFQDNDKLYFLFSYLYDKEESRALEKQLNAFAREIAGISVYGKVRTLHDRLAESVAYDNEGLGAVIRSPSMFSAVGPLLHRRAVCEGISKFACYVLRRLNVPVAVCVGKHEGVGHAWNIYQHENGRVAHTDITFDITFHGTPHAHRYFDLDEEYILRDGRVIL